MIERTPRSAPKAIAGLGLGRFFKKTGVNFACLNYRVSYLSSAVDRKQGLLTGRALKWLKPNLNAYRLSAIGYRPSQIGTIGNYKSQSTKGNKQQRLSGFIRDNMESILRDWEGFAPTIDPQISTMAVGELRHHASQMLIALATDLDRARSDTGKSGEGAVGDTRLAAETHAVARLHSGYTIVHLVSEYRALRYCVLSLWSKAPRSALATDPTDVMRFNEAVDQAMSESVARYQQLVDQSQNMFLAILGHDLRNPLGALIAGANLMKNDIDIAPKHAMMASRMFSSAKRMRKLIDDLIDFTRTHLGAGIPVKVAPGNLVTVCRQVVNELRTVYPMRFVDLRTPPKLEASFDVDRIAQVLSNLIGNALQYGNEIFPVRVFVGTSDETVEITVNNRGGIIPADRISGIFDAMVRLAANAGAGEAERTSLGIGLYISREIIKAHGGQISVVSEVEHGTTFTVTMPRQAGSNL